MVFTLFFYFALLLQAVDLAPITQKQNFLDLQATSCNINIQTGPNKKFEDIILGMKRQLDDIQKELRNLTQNGWHGDRENNTKGSLLPCIISHYINFSKILRISLTAEKSYLDTCKDINLNLLILIFSQT